MGNYDDIINLPHHVSKEHPPMSMYQRAAQFAPFAALTGHDAAIREMARLTDSQIVLDDESNEMLNRRMAVIRERLEEHPKVTITYFISDSKKAGGSYQTYTGNVRTIDDYEHLFIMTDGMKIAFASILYIDI